MSIRKRLTLFFILMAGLVVLMGTSLHVGGPLIVSAFRQSLDSMESLNTIREIKTALLSEKTSISRYLLIEDQQELIRFEEASKSVTRLLGNFKTSHGEDFPWLEELKKNFLSADNAARHVADEYKRGLKLKAQDEWSTLLIPKLQFLIDTVDKIEKDQAEDANSTFNVIRALTGHLEKIMMVLFVSVLFIGFALFRSLYKAVMRPLSMLERGAMEFGKGHWDYFIELPSTNEFGALAKAFNAMAENVKQLQLQAVHMDRMSAVGQLAGGVAHEINNPLTAVLGQSQILLAKLPETDPSHAALKKIENGAIRCRKIVRGLLDFSRPTQSSFESIDMNTVVETTLDLCEADLRKAKINIEKRFLPNLPKIQGNSSELQQVLLNLINNSIHAMAKGGNLILETRLRRTSLLIMERRKGLPPRELEGPWVEVVVTDTGIGIAKEHLGRVFEPFFTTKEIGKGTGLGLAVSMGIVQKHSGDLRVESEGLNRGAIFTMALPIRSEGTLRPIAKRNGGALS